MAKSQKLEARLPIDAAIPYCQGTQKFSDFTEYHIELLRLALKYSGQNIPIVPVCMNYPTERRRAAMLWQGDEINIAFLGTNQARERDLLAVHFPMFLGTTGLRMFITRTEFLPMLEHVRVFKDLKKFSFGQGLGWPDGQILMDNGLNVVNGRYQTLHAMLALGRFDLYPRAYWQVAQEFSWMKEHHPDLALARNLALYYPQPIYFFVSPNDPKLHDAILQGLEKAYRAGAVTRLLRTNWQTAPSFRDINLRDLRLIYLPHKVTQTPATHTAMEKYGLFGNGHDEILPAIAIPDRARSTATDPRHGKAQ